MDLISRNESLTLSLNGLTMDLPLTVNGNVTINGTLSSYRETGSSGLTLEGYATGPAAGASPVVSTAGTERGGVITVGASTTVSAGIVITVDFEKSMTNSAYVVGLTPGNAATAAITNEIYVTTTVNAFSICSTASLTSGTSYIWYYSILAT
jgi:hypothetical protein